jgi:hypothetical protein
MKKNMSCNYCLLNIGINRTFSRGCLNGVYNSFDNAIDACNLKKAIKLAEKIRDWPMSK